MALLMVGRDHAVLVRKNPNGTSIWKYVLKYANPKSGNAHNPTPTVNWEMRDKDGKVIDVAYRMRDLGKE